MKGIVKDFGGLRALDNVNLVLYPGDVLGLVGENAAGKSTLIKILTGVYPKTAGEIYWQGQHVEIRNRSDAMKLGIFECFSKSFFRQRIKKKILGPIHPG